MKKTPSHSWRQALEIVAVMALFTILTFFMFRPISLDPGGLLFDRWDGLLHTWILSWDIHKLFGGGWSNFFDANIFWPHKNALAYSDHLLGSAILAAPFYLVTGNPILAHNAVGMLSFILSGLGMYLLTRRFVPGRGAAVTAGLIYAFCPWRFGQLGHQDQLLTGQWMPFALLFLHRTFETMRWRDAFVFALFFTLQALCSFYLAALMGTAAATVFAVELFRARLRLDQKLWMRLSVVALFSALVLLPTMLPYYKVRREHGLQRSIKESIDLSADPLDYLCAPPWNRLWGGPTPRFYSKFSPFPNENVLFPGALALLLGLLSVIRFKSGDGRAVVIKGRFRGFPPFLEWEPHQGLYLALALTAFVLSLGPQLHVFWKLTPIPLPYRALYYVVPGFKALRVPSRFAYLFMLALSVLAAYGYRKIERKFHHRAWKYACILIIGGGIMGEYYSAPLPHHSIPAGEAVPPVYRWLAKQPSDAPVTHLPQYPGFQSAPEELYDPLGFTYMYYSAYHNFQPMTNGRSGFIPPSQRVIWKALMTFPSKRALNLLRYLKVKCVVVHTDAYADGEGIKVARRADSLPNDLKLVFQSGPDKVYRVKKALPESRIGELEGAVIKEVFLPPRFRPGRGVDMDVRIEVEGDYPVFTFKLVDMAVSAAETGRRGARFIKGKQKIEVSVLPGQSQWISFTLDAPLWEGDYKWEGKVYFVDQPRRSKAFAFDIKVGNYPDSLDPGALRAEFIEWRSPARVARGEEFTIEARVKNTGDTIWVAHARDGDYRGVVMLGAKGWYGPDKKPLPEKPGVDWGHLERTVNPGEETAVELKAWAPSQPGIYYLKLDMVASDVKWFGEGDPQALWVEVEVTDK